MAVFSYQNDSTGLPSKAYILVFRFVLSIVETSFWKNSNLLYLLDLRFIRAGEWNFPIRLFLGYREFKVFEHLEISIGRAAGGGEVISDHGAVGAGEEYPGL